MGFGKGAMPSAANFEAIHQKPPLYCLQSVHDAIGRSGLAEAVNLENGACAVHILPSGLVKTARRGRLMAEA